MYYFHPKVQINFEISHKWRGRCCLKTYKMEYIKQVVMVWVERPNKNYPMNFQARNPTPQTPKRLNNFV